VCLHYIFIYLQNNELFFFFFFFLKKYELQRSRTLAHPSVQGTYVLVKAFAVICNKLPASVVALQDTRVQRLVRVLTLAVFNLNFFLPSYLHDRIIRFLHIQVYDPSIDVAERALLALEEACADPACSDTLVKLRPKYDHLQDVANPLILKLLSRPSGIEYLLEMDTIDKVRCSVNCNRN